MYLSTTFLKQLKLLFLDKYDDDNVTLILVNDLRSSHNHPQVMDNN